MRQRYRRERVGLDILMRRRREHFILASRVAGTSQLSNIPIDSLSLSFSMGKQHQLRHRNC
jgi:hypothetical protein